MSKKEKLLELARISPEYWMSLRRRGYSPLEMVAYIDAVCYEQMIGKLPPVVTSIADILQYDAGKFAAIWEKIKDGFVQIDSGHYINKWRDVGTAQREVSKKAFTTSRRKLDEAYENALIEFMVPGKMVPHIERFLQFKKEKGQSYKPIGLRGMIKNLMEHSGGDPASAAKIIDRTIANNWNGLFPLPTSSPRGGSPGAERNVPDDVPIELMKKFKQAFGEKR